MCRERGVLPPHPRFGFVARNGALFIMVNVPRNNATETSVGAAAIRRVPDTFQVA